MKKGKAKSQRESKKRFRAFLPFSDLICPKCKSESVIIVTASYPKSYECKNCGYTFLKTSKTFVDE